MCYNIAIKVSPAQIQEAFDLVNGTEAWEGPRSHLTIGQYVPAITSTDDGKALEMMYWGFTPAWWSKDEKGGMRPGNARADTVSSTPMFRGAFKSKRCIVPATGFFEWRGEKGSKELVPFNLREREIFAFPGIWDEWTMPDGTPRRSLAIITADPNEDIRPYHDRMPVILDRVAEDLWLSATAKKDDLLSLLMPLGDGEIITHPDEAFKPRRGHKDES